MPDPIAALRDALRDLGRQTGIDVEGAVPLRLHDASTLLLPASHLVVRLIAASPVAFMRAQKAVSLTAWLVGEGFPATRPALAEPVELDEYVATVWHEVPRQQDQDPVALHRALGQLVKELHALPSAPVPLPTADPLARLKAALELDRGRPIPVLSRPDDDFLQEQVELLQERYDALSFPLGIGLIHNDANPSNALADPTSRNGYVLTDWESACIGPREMDVVLVGAPGSRFGDTEDVRQAFTNGYGYDIATWPGHRTLRDIRDLHSLAGHIRAAPHSPAALAELNLRVRSLRDGDRSVRWHAI